MEIEHDFFNRDLCIKRIEEKDISWDVIVIGGGATGLGVALDASSRGFKTLLLEQADFAKGTSSRSTKLVHGGVRYLAQGNVALVYEALHERGLLFNNAPHLVKRQAFVIPNYQWWGRAYYSAGLKMYDLLAGSSGIGKSTYLTRDEVIALIPNIERQNLKGGVKYFDGQFDDARLALNIGQTCAENGGVVLNYFKVKDVLKKENGQIRGVMAEDLESNKIYHFKSRVVVNATGVFVDEILQMDTPARQPLVRPSQGVHVVLDKTFLQGNTAIMIPKTADGRVLFAVPWYDHVLLGTTDTPLDKHSLEPHALEEEINFILRTAASYLIRKPLRSDVLSVFAGLRPLAAPTRSKSSTKEISRSHKLLVSDSRLITITGGKWTTFRKMAEDTVDKAIVVGNLPAAPCITSNLKIHGYANNMEDDSLAMYGSDKKNIKESVDGNPDLGEKLHKKFPFTHAEVIWAVQNEMARTVEDVLARRMRILFLDAKVAIDMAPKVADIMAQILKRDKNWKEEQVRQFIELAGQYLLEPYSHGVEEEENRIKESEVRSQKTEDRRLK